MDRQHLELLLVREMPYGKYKGRKIVIPWQSDPKKSDTFVVNGEMAEAVSDYIDLMPNFKASVEAWKMQPELKTITQKDGKFYVLPLRAFES